MGSFWRSVIGAEKADSLPHDNQSVKFFVLYLGDLYKASIDGFGPKNSYIALLGDDRHSAMSLEKLLDLSTGKVLLSSDVSHFGFSLKKSFLIINKPFEEGFNLMDAKSLKVVKSFNRVVPRAKINHFNVF